MRRHLPGRVELAVFAIIAMISAIIVTQFESHDAGLAVFTFPIFLFSAILGLWKSGRLRSVDEQEISE